MPPKSVIIIGAGIGGLSSAIRLQASGYQVTLLEKNAQVGGKMYQLERDGFRWDTGPSVITMRHVFEDLFASAGRRLEDYLTLLPVHPLTRYFYPDGVVLDAVSDLSQMANNIARINPRDVEGYLAYLAYAARIHRITSDVFIYNRPPTLASFARVPVQDWLKADPLRVMSQAINQHVKSPHLRQLLGRFATYVGGSPYLAPATLNVIAHVELTGGVWYPQGGIYQIAQALQRLALELGVNIRTHAPVAQILHQARRITGVRLESGEVLAAQALVCNADVIRAFSELLSEDTASRQRFDALRQQALSGSGFLLLLGLDNDYANLAHHNIFFSADYHAEFDAIFKQGVMPDDPTIYVAITSKTDPDHAPSPQHANWFVMVNAPALSDKFQWDDATRQRYRDLVLDKLQRFGLTIRPHILSETILTPHDLAHMNGAWQGALYGASANSKFTVFRRPHNRSRDLHGLYFAGGTTHPGGGVPMVMLSGKVAAELLMEDHPL